MAAMPTRLESYVLLRRPDVVQAEYELKAANANIGAARAALFQELLSPAFSGLQLVASQAFHGRRLWLERGGGRDLHHFPGGRWACQSSVDPSTGARCARNLPGNHPDCLPRGFGRSLARRGTINDEIAAQQRNQSETADAYILEEDRYRAGIDPFLNVLDSQRSYYTAQQSLVATKLAAAQNIVTTYQTVGGDTLLEGTPICQKLPGDIGHPNAVLGLECLPD